jgi:hypothetical protein
VVVVKRYQCLEEGRQVCLRLIRWQRERKGGAEAALVEAHALRLHGQAGEPDRRGEGVGQGGRKGSKTPTERPPWREGDRTRKVHLGHRKIEVEALWAKAHVQPLASSLYEGTFSEMPKVKILEELQFRTR